MIRLGQKADPVILREINHYLSRDFRSSLSYHFQAGGKRVRAAIVFLSCGAAGGSFRNALVPAALVEMIHNYSLVMDDIIDHADLRRGKPSVRKKFGNSVALLIAMAYRELLDQLIEDSVNKDMIRPVAIRSMTEIIDGERLDLLLEQSGRTDPYLISNRIFRPSFGIYLNMIGMKTASLFRAAGEIGAYSALATERIVRSLGLFGWNAGIAFQIMDDVLDIIGNNTGKEPAKDIIEHKLGNAVILVALKFLSKQDRHKLFSIIQSPKVTTRMADRARILVAQTPAEETCRGIVRSYTTRALKQLDNLNDSRYKQALVSLVDNLVYRSF